MTEIRGLSVPEAGTYVLMADVVASIREYAQALDDPNAGALIHDLATWLDGGVPPAEVVFQNADESFPDVFGAEDDDVSEGVARVEIYPDPPDDPRPKWYARSVDTGGYILKTTNGSYDQEWVIQNAQERWPGRDIHVLRSAGEDSKWIENQTSAGLKPPNGNRGEFPSLGPPPRRLWAGAGR